MGASYNSWFFLLLAFCLNTVPMGFCKYRKTSVNQSYSCIVNLSSDWSSIQSDDDVKYANKTFKHFWKSTGFSMLSHCRSFQMFFLRPLKPRKEFLLSPDEKFNLIFIGSLPHNGIQQVRIHWLLDLIIYEPENCSYNYAYLDNLLDFMQENMLRPGFELMGLPSNIDEDQALNHTYTFWYQLTDTITKHLIDRYGYEEVQNWRFETMNEPDLKQYNFLNFTLDDYLLYFKGCTDALHNISNNRQQQSLNQSEQESETETVDDSSDENRSTQIKNINERSSSQQQDEHVTRNALRHNKIGTGGNRVSHKNEIKATGKRMRKAGVLRVGGPAGLFKQRDHHPLCWGMLDMCNATWGLPSTACHLQYISFHKKGGGSAGQVLKEDLMMLDVFRQEYSFLEDMPIANDEADILTNWSLNKTWRADVRYAALMTKVIIQHHKEIVMKRNVQIEVLSNDNAFLNYHPNYFTQRTLLTRFQMNNTKPRHVQFIKKPVYIAMGLLSLLGDDYLPDDQLISSSSFVEVLATKRESCKANVFSILVVAVKDNATQSYRKERCNVTITLTNFDYKSLVNRSDSILAIYKLDNLNTNPYRVWKRNKSPAFPTKEQRKQMRQVEGPLRLKFSSFSWCGEEANEVELYISASLPSVHLVHICVDSVINVKPGRVSNLRGYFVTNNEVLLTWNDAHVKSRCIKTYEVEYQASPNKTFKRINIEDIILLSYQHDESNYVLDDGTGRFNFANGNKTVLDEGESTRNQVYVKYRVRAVDYWNRAGRYSNVISGNDIIHFEYEEEQDEDGTDDIPVDIPFYCSHCG